jgi:hypothetical protein
MVQFVDTSFVKPCRRLMDATAPGRTSCFFLGWSLAKLKDASSDNVASVPHFLLVITPSASSFLSDLPLSIFSVAT